MGACPTCGQEWPDNFKLCPNDGSSLRSETDETDLVGSVIADRYQVKSKLGEGGMGAVYLAEHMRMGQEVAIKVASRQLASDPEAVARFTREARSAARIKHPNVCVVHDFGETTSGLVYLAMEYIEGGSLSQLINRARTVPLAQVGAIIAQCCDALQAAHDLDIVHRDIKPDNIMVTNRRDGTVAVKLVDFGIAKAFTPQPGEQVTKTGFIVGTPDYMSPEQVSGDPVDGRSDVYSLALVLFRMLTDRLPFEADTPQGVLVGRLTTQPLTLAEVLPQGGLPSQLQNVLDRALARDREQRYATAIEFGQAVTEAVGGADPATEVIDTAGPTLRIEATPTPETPQPTPLAKTTDRRSGIKMALFGTGGLVAAGLVWMIAGSGAFPSSGGSEQSADTTPLATAPGLADPESSVEPTAGGTDPVPGSGVPANPDSASLQSPQPAGEREGTEGEPSAAERLAGDAVPDEDATDPEVSSAAGGDAYRGMAWAEVTHGLTTAELEGIWGSPTDLWVVGAGGTLLHYDGSDWSHAISPEQSRVPGTRLGTAGLSALWGNAPDDIWAVGSAILHYDGSSWTDETPDLDLGGAGGLNAVWGTGAGDIWAVGGRGTIVHYENAVWVDVAGGDLTPEDLFDVWGSNPSDVWAVGEGGVVFHYDGAAWSDATPGLGTEWLYGIWGSGPADVWAVGNSGTILRYDGASWADVTQLRRFSSGQIGPEHSWNLYGISGTSPSDIWVASQGPVLHYDGETWTDETPGALHRLSNVWVAGPGEVWAVGWWGLILRLGR